MQNPVPDERYSVADEAILGAFFKLLKKKTPDQITVSDITKTAGIARSTFYNHYGSIYDVAEELEAEIIKVLFENTQKLNSLDDIFNYLDEIIIYLKKNEDMYRLLLASNEPQVFLKKLKHSILDKLYNSINNNSNFKNSNSLKFEVAFFTDVIVTY